MNGVTDGLGDPTVSVVIPTFRRSEYLSEALSSALAQTYRDLEVIVTDNDSQGLVPEAVAGCADRRLRYRRNATNLGPMRNFLRGVAEARGRYVACLHDDDCWEPTLLERLVPYLDRDPTVVLAFAESHIIDAEGRIDVAGTEVSVRRWGRDRLAAGRHAHFACSGLLHGSISGVVGSVIRRSAIDWCDFPEEVTFAYDLWLVYLAVCTGGATVYHPERLVRYREHGGNATSDQRAHEASVMFCYDQFLADDRLRQLRRRFQVQGADHRASLATALMRAHCVRDARPLLRKAVQQHPTPRALVALLVSLLPSRFATSLSATMVAAKRRLVSNA
jgi:glycosyltransferase involved in cell wall biosynthesis